MSSPQSEIQSPPPPLVQIIDNGHDLKIDINNIINSIRRVIYNHDICPFGLMCHVMTDLIPDSEQHQRYARRQYRMRKRDTDADQDLVDALALCLFGFIPKQ